MFYIYKNKDKYITITGFKIGLTRNVEKCAWWSNKKSAKTWENTIKYKYPDAELKEAALIEINPKIFG